VTVALRKEQHAALAAYVRHDEVAALVRVVERELDRLLFTGGSDFTDDHVARVPFLRALRRLWSPCHDAVVHIQRVDEHTERLLQRLEAPHRDAQVIKRLSRCRVPTRVRHERVRPGTLRSKVGHCFCHNRRLVFRAECSHRILRCFLRTSDALTCLAPIQINTRTAVVDRQRKAYLE
jgi:hypothetical protein